MIMWQQLTKFYEPSKNLLNIRLRYSYQDGIRYFRQNKLALFFMFKCSTNFIWKWILYFVYIEISLDV